METEFSFFWRKPCHRHPPCGPGLQHGKCLCVYLWVCFLEEILRTVWPDTFEDINLDDVIDPARSVFRQITELIVVVLLIRYFSRTMSTDLLSRIGWSTFRIKHVLWGFLGGGLLGLSVLAFGLVNSFENYMPVNANPDISPSRAVFFALWAVSGLCLAPLIEELVFRGILYLGFSQSWGDPWAALGVTLLFLSVHLYGSEDVSHMLWTTVLVGAVALLVRVKTDSLFPAMVFHCAYNMFWFIKMLWRFGFLRS